MSNSYSLNPVSRSLNNFFESATNSSNHVYIKPAQTYTPPLVQTYTAPVQEYKPISILKPIDIHVMPNQPYSAKEAFTTRF